MFNFEKLDVYAKAKSFNISVATFLEKNPSIDRSTKDQLKRAAFSIMLNIAEGSGRFTARDKKNFYVISRGSVFECVAILDFLKTTGQLDEVSFKQYYAWLEELSMMLFAMIKGLS
ncbi:MAG TPA: four helix bundle protein [Bacteroidales bacterium]|nr:four helix bundle protein [Bacteroidales bacterium]HRZ48816.1 four helix bundle protein [Bacteroidales bacterium]